MAKLRAFAQGTRQPSGSWSITPSTTNIPSSPTAPKVTLALGPIFAP